MSTKRSGRSSIDLLKLRKDVEKTELEIDSLEREKRDPESLLIVVIAVLIIGYAIYRLLS